MVHFSYLIVEGFIYTQFPVKENKVFLVEKAAAVHPVAVMDWTTITCLSLSAAGISFITPQHLTLESIFCFV